MYTETMGKYLEKGCITKIEHKIEPEERLPLYSTFSSGENG